MFTDPNLYALLYTITITLTYVCARTSKVYGPRTFAVALVANSICFGFYSVARQNSFTLAILNAIFLGVLFTTLSTLLGVFFRQVEQDGPVTQAAFANNRKKA